MRGFSFTFLAVMACSGSAVDPTEETGTTTDTATMPPEPEPLSFTVDGTIVRLRPGATVDISVMTSEEADLSVAGLPSGVTAEAATVDGAGAVTLTASNEADVGGPFELALTAVAGDDSASADLTLFVAGPAGSLDTTFGTDGSVTHPIGSAGFDFVTDAMLDRRSRLVVSGGGEQGWVARMLPDGSLDPAFGVGGIATFGDSTVRGVTADGTIDCCWP